MAIHLGKPRSVSSLTILIVAVLLVLLVIVAGVLVVFTSKLQNVLNTPPSYSAAQLSDKAKEQIDKGSYQSAESYLEQALLKENDATYRNNLAVVKYRLKKYGEAIEQYKLLIAAGKDEAFAWNGIGNAYRDWAEQDPSKKVDYQAQALDAYKKAIASNPQYVAAYSNEALLLSSMGRVADAQAVLDAGIVATSQPELTKLKESLPKE